MSITATFDHYMERVSAGKPLPAEEIRQLASGVDILPLGMLADALRRRAHGAQVTFLRVSHWTIGQPLDEGVLASSRELRIGGRADTLTAAAEAVRQARGVAGDRTVAGFSWLDIERLAEAGGEKITTVLEVLRDAGLDAIADLPMDAVADPAIAVDRLTSVGFQQLRLSIDKAPAADRVALLLRAAELQEQFACIETINPLPMTLTAFRPTTGYEDVKIVAIARLAAANVPTIQVDWRRYGPKLAQVALTFGADDLDNVPASDEAPEGRRRAPLEEIRRNIQAAGFEAAERDGRFGLIV